MAIPDSQKNGQFLKVLPFIATVMNISVSLPIFIHDFYCIAAKFFFKFFIYTEMETRFIHCRQEHEWQWL